MGRRRNESLRTARYGPVLAIGLLAAAGCSGSESDLDVADSNPPASVTTAPPPVGGSLTDLVMEIESGEVTVGTAPDSGGDTTVSTTGSTAPSTATSASTSATSSTTTEPPLTTSATSPSTTSSTARSTAPSTATSPTTSVAPADGGPFLAIDFQSSPTGSYDEARIRSEWPSVRYANTGGRNTIVDEDGNRFLRVEFPRGEVGHNRAGTLWKIDLDDNSADELYLSYRVRFGPGFDFVKGGKLPGLSGGEDNTGGDVPNGTDGWSARMMWRAEGEAVQYVYHPDQPTQWGEDLDWGRRFSPDRWVTVETRIRMNVPGRSDGMVESWMDGERTLSRSNLRFRDNASFGIDSLLFHTFFGGSGADWAPTQDERIDFDDVVISNTPITH